MQRAGFGPRRLLAVVAIVLVVGAVAHPARGGQIIGYKWTPIGPQPNYYFFAGGDTGRTTSIAVNPFNADDIWIGTAGGGVWHSSDGGQHWSPMSDDQASLAIGSLALSGCSAGGCTTVYAGTGENAIRRDTYYGAGLLVGTVQAGGVQWTLRNGTPTYDFTHGSVYDVVLDPTTSGATQVLYIALSSGVTASASEATVTAPEPSPGGWGLYKSADNGATWTKLAVPGSDTAAGHGRPTDLEIDRTSPGTLYAGILGRGIFKSNDGGASWCPLNPGIPKPTGCPQTYGLPNPGRVAFDNVELDIYRGDHNHVYAVLGDCPDRLLADCEPMIYESTDGGIHWTQRDPGSITQTPASQDIVCPRGYSRYMHKLTISPTDPANLFLTGYHLCESTNNGVTWFATDHNSKAQYNDFQFLHPDHHAVIFHDSLFNRMYDVNDGGVALSSDGGFSWTPSVNGLAAIEFQSIAASPDTPRVIGGSQDNSAMMWTGSKQWQALPCCGDGGFSIVENYFNGLYNVLEMYVTSNVSTNTGATSSNTTVLPIRSSDGGTSWPQPGVPPASYDVGLNTTESRSFYPPLVSLGPDYLGTNRLWSSVDALGNFTPRSPALSTASEPEIFSGADAITAIAVSPSNPSRIYLGYYGGQVFVTDAACTSPSCWSNRSAGLPGSPVTWIAVDPTAPDTAYATVSGFGPGVHVYKTTNAGVSWSPTGSLAELNGIPADTIAVDPNDANTLYLGTDHGVYKSLTGGGSWFPFKSGLPNVPIYGFALDPSRGRIIAATHGRSAFILSPIFMHVYGLFNHALVLDQPVFAGGFGANQSCLVKVLRQDGSVCASGRTDALGGTIQTDAQGFLVSTKTGYFGALPLVWACAQGKCLGTDIGVCNQAGNPMAAVEATCGSQTVRTALTASPATPDPRSSRFTLSGTQAGPLPTSGNFTLLPAVQNGDGSTRLLCSVNVPFSASETQGAVLHAASDAVNADPGCMAAGVAASVSDPVADGAAEDLFAHPGFVSLRAQGLTGGQLVPSVRTAPGQATGICFSAAAVDDPVRAQLHGLKLEFTTSASGATGGTILVIENTGLGECSIPVAAPAGGTAAGIASAIAAAFQAPGIPSPYPGCSVESNPRDLVAQGPSVLSALASELVVCVSDPGVGVSLVPAEICATDADCDDGNPCTQDSCNPLTGACQSTPQPNGLSCEDNNPCTVGNTCQNGTCGTPVTCNDGNPCTTDRCDPATGAGSNTAVSCDDGNPCTSDTCSAATGGCVFTPTPGAACNDGDSCTSGDTCVQNPGDPVPTCHGTPKCADGDPCTADVCDPATGACSNPPIVCDDGNPCTTDTCVGGVCVSSVTAGGTCSDGNRCTTGDACVPGPSGAPVCQGQPVNCDDGNACTVDTCDPVTGGCGHTPVAIAEVAGLTFTSHTTLTWPAVPGASYYDTYRGTIPAGGFGNRGPGGPTYDQTCFEEADSLGDGSLVSTDAQVPPVGTGFYYLVSQFTACGEGPIGTDSDGTVVPNSSPCPVP